MRPVAQAAASAARQWTKHALPQSSRAATSAMITSTSEPHRRAQSTTTNTASGGAASASFDSPFKGAKAATDFNRVPDFSRYMAKGAEPTTRVFQYFMVGSMGLLAAAGAKATVQGKLDQKEGIGACGGVVKGNG